MDAQIKVLSEEVSTKDKLIDSLRVENDEKDLIIEGWQSFVKEAYGQQAYPDASPVPIYPQD